MPEYPNLHAGTVLAILENRVAQIQLVFSVRDDIVGPNTQIIQFAEKLELPIVIRFVNQRRLGKTACSRSLSLNTQMIPPPAQPAGLGITTSPSRRPRRFCPFERKADERFYRNVERITANVVLKVESRIKFQFPRPENPSPRIRRRL